MTKKIKEHENIYIHIKRENWWMFWRIFWGIFISVAYWSLSIHILNSNIVTMSKWNMFHNGIASLFFYALIMTIYIALRVEEYKNKFE